MKKILLLTTMLLAIQAQAVTIVVPHVTPHVSTPHISTSSHITTSHVNTTSSASKMTNTAKTVTPNVVKPNKVVEAQGSKEVIQPTTISIGSLNSKVKSFGCEAPKEVKKVEPPKCDK